MPKRPLKRASDLSREFQQDSAYAALYREVVHEEIGAMLRVLRKSKGMTQREVAKVMGVTRPRISQIESAEGATLTLEVLNRYARALGCSLKLSIHDQQSASSNEFVIPPLPPAGTTPAATHAHHAAADDETVRVEVHDVHD